MAPSTICAAKPTATNKSRSSHIELAHTFFSGNAVSGITDTEAAVILANTREPLKLDFHRNAGGVQEQRRLAGAPLELAAVLVAVAEVAAQPALQHARASA